MADVILDVFGAIVGAFFALVLVETARFVLPMLTFGQWRVARFKELHLFVAMRGPYGEVILGRLPAYLIGLVIWIVIGLSLFAAHP